MGFVLSAMGSLWKVLGRCLDDSFVSLCRKWNLYEGGKQWKTLGDVVAFFWVVEIETEGQTVIRLGEQEIFRGLRAPGEDFLDSRTRRAESLNDGALECMGGNETPHNFSSWWVVSLPGSFSFLYLRPL